MMMMNCFCGMVDQQKMSYFQPGPLPEILTIANLWIAASRIWTYAEPEFRVCWMKLCSSDNHYTLAPQNCFLVLLITVNSNSFVSPQQNSSTWDYITPCNLLLSLHKNVESSFLLSIGSYKIGPVVLPSFRLSVLPLVLWSRCFLEIVSLVFSKFWHVPRNPYEIVHDRVRFFLLPKLGKWTKNGPKTRFFDLLKNLVINFYWICSIMKIYIIFCVPAKIPYFGKFLFFTYGPKCSQPIRLQDFLISHISRINNWKSWIFYMLIQIHINQKLIKKFLGGLDQKWVWLVWSWVFNIDWISRMNRWNELIFWML